MNFHLLIFALMVSLMSLMDSAQTSPTNLTNFTNLTDSTNLTDFTNSTEFGESISEAIAKANQNTTVHLVERDIIVDGERNVMSCYLCKWPKSGLHVEIPVRFDPGYSSSEKSLIRSAMKTIVDRTCIRFYEFSEPSTYHLYIYPGDGCYSYIGRQYSTFEQRVSLSKYGCLKPAIIQHEILHTLGFSHEHSRSDRDSHLTILYDNIIPGQEYNFNKHQTNNLYTPYDFNSVMQYHNYEFSKNGRPTLLSKMNPRLRFGYATGLSYYDILRVNRFYEC